MLNWFKLGLNPLKGHKLPMSTAAIIACLLFAFFSYLNVMRLGTVKMAWNVDENHTIFETSKSILTPVTAPHVFGGARWALRLSYPLSTLYMTTRMGGEHHVTSWQYPGHFYILLNFQDPDPKVIQLDPNLQDYIFFQRIIFIQLFIASLAFIFYALFRVISGWSAGIYLIGIWMSPIIDAQLYYAYADIFIASVANSIFGLLLLACITKIQHLKTLVFLCAVAISSKINGFFLALPVLGYFYSINMSIRKNWIHLIVIFIAAWLVLNSYELVHPDAFLHYVFANIYHYKTGHWVTEPSGLFQLKKINQSMPYFFGVTAISIIIFFTSQWKKRNFRFISLAVIFVACLYILSLTSLRFFYERNCTILILLLALFSAINIGGFISDFLKPKWLGPLFAFSILMFIGCNEFYMLSERSNKIIQESLKNCSKIGVIGEVEISKSINQHKIPSIPSEYTFAKDVGLFVDQAKDYDCVVARWGENDKSYTNYLLPQMYRLKARSQDIFVYESWQK